MSQILIIDDEPTVCWALEKYFTSRGHESSCVASAEEVLRRRREQRTERQRALTQVPSVEGAEDDHAQHGDHKREAQNCAYERR